MGAGRARSRRYDIEERDSGEVRLRVRSPYARHVLVMLAFFAPLIGALSGAFDSTSLSRWTLLCAAVSTGVTGIGVLARLSERGHHDTVRRELVIRGQEGAFRNASRPRVVVDGREVRVLRVLVRRRARPKTPTRYVSEIVAEREVIALEVTASMTDALALANFVREVMGLDEEIRIDDASDVPLGCGAFGLVLLLLVIEMGVGVSLPIVALEQRYGSLLLRAEAVAFAFVAVAGVSTLVIMAIFRRAHREVLRSDYRLNV